MKRISKNNEAKMPMLEIVISVGIFTIISVFLLKMFISANTLEENAKILTKAVLSSETIAETIKGEKNLEKAMNELAFNKEKDGTYKGIYNEIFTVVISTAFTDNNVGTLMDGVIDMYYDGKKIYTLNMAAYEQEPGRD